MLDRASLDRLSRTPEKNAPMLNVALAEEGPAPVLLSLARSPAVGPEAIAVIAARVAREGAEVGRDPEAQAEDHVPVDADLDRLLVVHPRAPSDVLEAVVARRAADAFHVLAGACHPSAPLAAVERAVDWPSASPVHDRLWLALLDPASIPPLTLAEWAQDPSPLRREAAARVARDPALLAALAADPSRRVRRAVASNRLAAAERARLAVEDLAPEVRARAAGPLTAHGDLVDGGSSADAGPTLRDATIVETARFAAGLRAMSTGGVLAPDVTRALSGALGAGAALDPEGALWGARVLPRKELGELLDRVIGDDLRSPPAMGLAAGLALRPLAPLGGEADEGELTEVVYEAVKSLSRTTTAESRLTGKARLAAWAAEGLSCAACVDRAALLDDLARHPIGADRMVLARGAALRASMVSELCEAAPRALVVPAALLELAWADPAVPDAALLDLAARIPKPRKRAEDLPEDEVDLDPSLRALELLERVVLTATARANTSPRAALAVVALDARRVRYILSAMPQWKGRLTGGRLARVLRQHAGAISAAHAEARTRASHVEEWTHRLLSETELSIALAVGHRTGAEVARRIAGGRQPVDDGLTLAWGAEARAALEGAASVQPILDWATKHRASQPGALAVWLLLERFDRERAPSLVASCIDGLATGQGVVPASVCDALAALEHRSPGRLETIHPQSPRGRATLASAIARAYRAIGGMRDERQGP
ncbi:MAG: hypothetical protein IT372_18760 [Polyangiaceae bacterium]|nr:hypothetical protein [Polyangiaceae bacterium]